MLCEGVISLIQVNFDKFEGRWNDFNIRLDHVERKLNDLQERVTEHLSSESVSSSASTSSGSNTSRKRKRKTPVTLQVLCVYLIIKHFPIFRRHGSI